MTKAFIERKNKMIELYKEGLTYQEIGEKFNVSRQRVYQMIGGHIRDYFKPITSEECIYPNLRKWMNDNRVNRPELCRRLYGHTHPNLSLMVNHFLKGSIRQLSKITIDKYINVTGLTYEELFDTGEGA